MDFRGLGLYFTKLLFMFLKKGYNDIWTSIIRVSGGCQCCRFLVNEGCLSFKL